ncbi:MAG: hypothetical protein LBS19_09650 [Clostridiales bacterium]|nr:hypothetical protein [Clostridiales bacterium]
MKLPNSMRLNNKIRAAKARYVFFLAMLAFTFISRAMDGITVAKCRVDVKRGGSITLRISLDGEITDSVFESVTLGEDAEKLSIGDTGVITYSNDGLSFNAEAVITRVENGTLTASLPESIYPQGISPILTVTKTSPAQRNILPISALRSDYSGDFVLVAQEKKTVIGAGYSARRVSVTVEMRDTARMSVSGSLNDDDLVIVYANKPVSEGDRVRSD